MSRKRRKPKSSAHNDKIEDLGRLIIRYMTKDTSQTYTYKEIARGIGLKNPAQREWVAKALHQLNHKGKVKEVSKGRYMFDEEDQDTLIGTIDFNQSGNAYVTVRGFDDDFFVHQKNVKNALQGDKVAIIPFHFKKKKAEAAVAEVVERKKTQFVGTFQYVKTKDVGFVVCDKKILNTDFFIPRDKFGGAKDGDKVIVKLIEWKDNDKNPKAQITEVLGRPGEHETEIHSILAEYGLPYDFPPEVEAEANHLNTELDPEEIKRRRDFREVLTFTIDPKDAKDFDDAVSLRQLENGNWEVGVHIADVSHYVRPNTILDEEAYERGTSVYLVDRVVPMLPEVLSNNLCSLRPDEDKFTFSAVFELNDHAEIQKQWFGRTVIRSNKRLTYEEAQESIEKGTGELVQEIQTLNNLAVIMREARMKKGAIAFDKQEVRFNLDENKDPIGVYFKVSKEANHLIEEFMLLANKKVAEFVSLNRKGGLTQNTFIYRVHDNPDPVKVAALRDLAATFGYKMNISNPQHIAQSLNELLTKIKGKPEQDMLETLAMRSMAKAIYSTENLGHYGLAFEFYTHFTSPIRRYPDIIAHRMLQHYLDGGRSLPAGPYEEKAKHCSEREKVASDAERDSIKFMQVKFMEKHVGEVFEGVISGVTDWGIFVEIPENGAEGLIRMRDLTDDSYYFDEKTYSIVGYSTGNSYQLGEKVRIKVVRANVIAKQLDFKLVE